MDDFNENFGQLYKENKSMVFAFVYHMTNDRNLAADITQEAFIKAYKQYDSLSDRAKTGAWLKKIAYHTFIDHKRRKSSRTIAAGDEVIAAMLSGIGNSLHLEVEQKIMSACVNSKIGLIPENYRAPLYLDIEGYSNREIADILNCTLENAKVRLFRARKKMKEILESECSFHFDERNVLC